MTTPIKKRRKTRQVRVGCLSLGSRHPIVIQSMTNTPTADISGTYKQIATLFEAGAEMVRMTVNDDQAALAAPHIIRRLRRAGYLHPLIGDFHYNGHQLLSQSPDCAQALDKYRINPGNVGKGHAHNQRFAQIIEIARKHKKPVRIGINGGSLDQELLMQLMKKNKKRKNPRPEKEMVHQCAIQSALESARLAEQYGLSPNQIILSIKMSDVQDLIQVNRLLAAKCDYPLHLGLTEAGGGLEGVIGSVAAKAILLEEGIGDTIRVSLTPGKNMPRTKEVEVCQMLLQSLGLRTFAPTVISCPGCGRTNSNDYQQLAEVVKNHINIHLKEWKTRFQGIENMKIAVMGCIVNGPGESRHADLGICLSVDDKSKVGAVYENGKYLMTLRGQAIAKKFILCLERYIAGHYSSI